VFKKGTALVPSYLAFAVVTLLEKHFGELVDYAFTARMEGVLDDIAHGEAARVPWLRQFYFGGDQPGTPAAGGDGASGAPEALAVGGTGLKPWSVTSTTSTRGKSAPSPWTARTSRSGWAGTGRTWSATASGQCARGHGPGRADAGAGRRAAQPAERGPGARTDPDTGLPVVAKSGRFGPYVTSCRRRTRRRRPSRAPPRC